jgi:hypothetical protein
MRSELKRLISVSAKTLVIMNKEFKNTPDRVSRSTTQRRRVIQAGNSYEKDASPKLTNGPSVTTEAKNGGSFQITKMEGRTPTSSSLDRNSESSGNGEGSHSEMGMENIITCRAKTYGNSLMEEGQKEKWKALAHSARQGTNHLLHGAYPPEECVNPPRADTYGDSFTERVEWKSEIRHLLGKGAGDP